MSDISEFRKGGGSGEPLEEAQLLYRELDRAHMRMGHQLLEAIDPELIDRARDELLTGEIGLELVMEDLPLRHPVAGADTIQPQTLARDRSIVLNSHLSNGGQIRVVPRFFDPPEPYHAEPSNTAFVAVSMEGPTIIGSTQDIEHLSMLRRVEAGLAPEPEFKLTEIDLYNEGLRAIDEVPRYLTAAECEALRGIVPLLRLDLGDTILQGHLDG